MRNGDMPAQPVEQNDWWHGFLAGELGGKSYGLTKREAFVKAALQGILANPTLIEILSQHPKYPLEVAVGKMAVENAEAALAALEADNG